MMERFWLWLAHANARLVFIGALLGLIAAGGWQVWNELNPEQTLLPQAPPHPGITPPTQLPTLDFVAERQRRGTPSQVNPFDSTTSLTAHIQRPPRIPPTQPAEPPSDPPPSQPEPQPTPDPDPEPTQPDPPPRPPRPPRPPDPAPAVRSVQLRYNGRMIRPDGVTVAWIANSETAASHFHVLGDDLDGLRILDIEQDQMTIMIGEDTRVVIPRGATARFTQAADAAAWTHRPTNTETP